MSAPAARRVRRTAAAVLLTVLGASAIAACGTSRSTAPSTTAPTPLHAAPEPAVSPPAQASLPGTVLALRGGPEGVVVDGLGEVAVNVRHPDGVVLFRLGQPARRRTVALAGSARHLALAGPDGPLLVPDESDDRLVELSLPTGRVVASVAVGNHPHGAVALNGGTVLVADELANTIHVIRDGRVTRVVAAPLQPGGMAADATGTRAVVVGVRGREIGEYTPSGDLVGTAACGIGPTHVVAGVGGLFWVADTDGGTVLGFTLTRRGPLQVATIPVGLRPYGLAFDARRRTLWVTLTGSDRLVGLHLAGRRVASLTTFATVRQPDTVDVDTRTGELVVTGSTADGELQLIAGAP